MAEKRRNYGDEFKREAVRLVTKHGYGVSETARNLGINAHMLGRCKREVEAQQSAAFPGNGRVSPDQKELQRLREDNKRLRMERDILKKALGYFASGSNRGMPLLPSIRTCGRFRSCARCSTSVAVGFMSTCCDTPASVDAEEVALFARVKAIAAETRHSYGSRRMAKQLQDEGFNVGRAKARRLTNKTGVAVQRPRRRGPMTTDSRHGYEVAPNLLARQFDATAPNHVWAGDITYIWTAEGWLYLSVPVDLYSRKVVGWAMNHHMDTTLVQDALQMALGRRSPSAGLMHHSDRGSQYASHAYQAMLADHGIICSMSRRASVSTMQWLSDSLAV